MANNLNELESIIITQQQAGAYHEPIYQIQGANAPTTLLELLKFILAKLGIAPGGDVFLEAAALSHNTLNLTLNNGDVVSVDLSTLSGGGGADDFVTAASLAGNVLTLTRDSGATVTVNLAALAANDFVTAASLGGGNVLTLTRDSGATVTADLSALAGGGAAITEYDAGSGGLTGFWVRGTAGITVTTAAAGVYDIDVPDGGILERFWKDFTNAGTEFTGGGEVQININRNSASLNQARASAVVPAYWLVDSGGTQRNPGDVAVTVALTSVGAGATAQTIANVNGLGTPVMIIGQ